MRKIKQITIENVRGFKAHTIELDMLPNKPSILVAPNGSGKTSFAIAFNSLKTNKLDVDKTNLYEHNATNLPKIVVEMDDGHIYSADNTKNEISRAIGVYVINNQNKAKTTQQNVGGRFSVARTRMTVEPIILIDVIPSMIQLTNNFIQDYGLDSLTRGTIPNVISLLNNNSFIATCPFKVLGSRDSYKVGSFIERLKSYTGTKNAIWNKIETDDLPILSSISDLSNMVLKIKDYCSADNDAKLYLKAINLMMLYKKETIKFKQRIKFAKYKVEFEDYVKLFASLKDTWQNIRPKEMNDKLIIEIPNTDDLSNGERDIIVFFAMLQRSRKHLNKEYNILIIDEIFDYLDDANLVAAQYYITKFISDFKTNGKFIFPVILSHLNPDYYKNYAFKDMKVYYLKPISNPSSSDRMIQLVRKRNDSVNKSNGDLLSKYWFHFYYNYSEDTSAIATIFVGHLSAWQDVNVFKNYCKCETNKYLSNNSDFDAIAVCVWLRECIEKYIYDHLSVADKNDIFAKNGTNKKMEFAIEKGVYIPEIFFLLGLIYNNPLHDNNPREKDLRQTLYSRLCNNTIKSLIDKVVNNKL